MSKKESSKPAGYATITPHLIINDARGAIEFYKNVFGAKELMCIGAPGERVMHAELQIGDSKIMLADEFEEMGAKSPKAYGGSPVGLNIYVDDVDSVFKQAIVLGSKEIWPPADKFYGDRSGTLQDPFGHQWTISTHIEDISPEELERRAAELQGSCS